ncbi:MAG TPA: rod shape-determining protein MreD, partial [Acidimicrobiia bacterium]|nr:rod shape-determining protein MreD [Acidimicrobiia bacterium]
HEHHLNDTGRLHHHGTGRWGLMRLRTALIVATMLLIAVVLQTTLFSQTEVFVPDLVMLVVIVLSLTRLRPEALLGIAFIGGLGIDLLGSSVLGLRAMVFSIVCFIALRTRERADLGRVVIGLWVGLLTVSGVLLLLLIGTLFGQTVLLGEGLVGLLLLVPVANMILAWLFAPLVVRLVDRESSLYGFA